MTFRSKQMGNYRIIIPRENAYEVAMAMGQLDLVHLVDKGNYTVRQYYSQVKRCDQLIHKISQMEKKLIEKQIPLEEYDEDQRDFMKSMSIVWAEQVQQLQIQPIKLLDIIDDAFQIEWKRFSQLSNSIDKLNVGTSRLLEKIACFEVIQDVFGSSDVKEINQQYFKNNAVMDQRAISGISFIVSAIAPEMDAQFNKIIYRVSRGYACVKSTSVFKYPALKILKSKIILVIYPNSQQGFLQKKLRRVIQTFSESYIINHEIQHQYHKILKNTINQYEMITHIQNENQKKMIKYLQRMRMVNKLENLKLIIWREKFIYESLNKMKPFTNCLYAEIFLPVDVVEMLKLSLGRISPSPLFYQISSKQSKCPTAFDTNSYTLIAQQITDTYGVPRYQQVNPSIFTTVTFPFFFGVMFGDMAHGLILFILGIVLVVNNQTIKKSLRMASDLRYMITMMGFFAFYCGWIYNDFIGMSINLFGSCYESRPAIDETDTKAGPTEQWRPNIEADCVYPFGIDPIWGRAQNQLVYVNSLKMKIAVIIAIIHMSVGVIIKAFNSVYFKRKLDFYFEFIPQLVMLVLLFGYMDFLIIFKWLKDWSVKVNLQSNVDPRRWAPSIIGTMMNMGLKMGKTTTIPDGNSNMWGTTGDSSQDSIQLFILLISLLCIPLMLLPTPLIQINQYKKQAMHAHRLVQEQSQQVEQQIGVIGINNSFSIQEHLIKEKDEIKIDEEHSSSEIFVHQLIETIEFALGSVSNTASYLRLWALSLAHSQLAKVFFDKTLKTGFQLDPILGTLAMPILSYLLTWVTFGVLMCMDSMQCFLHSLRLHWVQFQNKFYKGDGYKYQPLSFQIYISYMKSKHMTG